MIVRAPLLVMRVDDAANPAVPYRIGTACAV